jgi:hypothetical protein
MEHDTETVQARALRAGDYVRDGDGLRRIHRIEREGYGWMELYGEDDHIATVRNCAYVERQEGSSG